jgi:hypothetical protein
VVAVPVEPVNPRTDRWIEAKQRRQGAHVSPPVMPRAQSFAFAARFLARDARRLATLPHVRTSCQAPLLFLERS